MAGKVVTVMNMKGGVGKTTVAAHVGGVIGRTTHLDGGYRKVLLIDYDPQFNLSQALLPADVYYKLEKSGKTSLAILQDDESVTNPYEIQGPGSKSPPSVADLAHQVYRFKDRGVDLVPSTLDLMYVALGHSEKRLDPFEDRFEAFINECRTVYDYIFIDCHPAGSILTKTSLQNSDHVLIPVSPQKYAVRGVQLMLRFISAKRTGAPGPTPHILFNACPRTGVSEEERLIRDEPRFADKCMTNTLKWYRVFSDPIEGKGFAWGSNKAWSTIAYWNLCDVAGEFLRRTNGVTGP